MTSLLFGVHAHQPAGNFPEVIEHAHARSYRPFLQILHEYPAFRFAVHFSGPLLDYLYEQHPEDMALLEAMVARGQVEMFGAGDTEPVLASIPARDRRGQLEQLARKLSFRFGSRPQGAWLTERVWESTVVPALAQTGIAYVTVDDYHFLCTGKSADELDGFFTTE
jgi:alpha-amylase/alpha-mannosidase (GH57 family)